MKCCNDTAVNYTHGRYARGYLYPAILFGTLFTPSAVQAENPANIERYTIQREKTSEFISSALRSGKRPETAINEQSGVYKVKVVALIAAPANYVRYVLTDYKHIYRLNPSIIESEVLERFDDGSVNVRTKVVGCAAYFCEELDRVEKVRILPSGDLHAEIIPELSQFKSGQTRWQIKPVGDYCEVTYLSEMEPDIYIPPVVGKFLIKKSIRQGMHTSFKNLENISTVLAERQWLEHEQTIKEAASDSLCTTCVSNAYDFNE